MDTMDTTSLQFTACCSWFRATMLRVEYYIELYIHCTTFRFVYPAIFHQFIQLKLILKDNPKLFVYTFG